MCVAFLLTSMRVQCDWSCSRCRHCNSLLFCLISNSLRACAYCNRATRDLIRRRLDGVLHKFTPSVTGDLYDVTFIPVFDKPPPADAVIPPPPKDLHVVAIRVAKGAHLIVLLFYFYFLPVESMEMQFIDFSTPSRRMVAVLMSFSPRCPPLSSHHRHGARLRDVAQGGIHTPRRLRCTHAGRRIARSCAD